MCVPCIVIETHCGTSNGELDSLIGEANALIRTNETFAETIQAMDAKGLLAPDVQKKVIAYCDKTRSRAKDIRKIAVEFRDFRDEAYKLLNELTGVS